MALDIVILGSLIVVFLVLILFYNKKIGSVKLGRLEPIKKKAIVFATPHRLELVLLSFYFLFFFIADLAQNKFLDLGLDYRVIVFWNQTALALDVWLLFLIAFHVCLVGLFMLSLKQKDTNTVYDFVVGTIALFGVGILLAGAIVQIYANTVHIFFTTMPSINLYHLGIYCEVFAGFYWAFTK